MTVLPPLDHISYSFLHVLVCPYAAFLRYDAAIKAPSTVYLALGNSIHQVLENAHKEYNFNLRSWVDEFKEEYNRLINDEEIFVTYPILKKMESDGISMLEVYHAQIESGQITKEPLGVETDFRIPVSGTYLVGRIDKIEDRDGELTVIDYKTGKWKPDPWLLRHNLQLTAYYGAAFELYGRFPTKLIWHHLRTGEQLETTRTQADLDNLKRMIDNAVKMREQGIRHRVYDQSICGDGSGRGIQCDYRGETCDDPELENKTVARLTGRQVNQ
jgi:RecB family exonuclease